MSTTFETSSLPFVVQEKLAALSNALLSAHPTIPVLLREIHTHLRNDPECVTLMKEEEINLVVKGLVRQTGVEIVSAAVKKPSISKNAMKNIGVDDI